MAVFYRNVDPNTPLSANIGFQAHSVLVDNYTAYYIYFADADAYVPPFYIGVVLPLLHTTDYARMEIKSPFANPQAPVTTSYFVHTVWTDASLAPAPGFLINDPTQPLPPGNVIPFFADPPTENRGVFPAISVTNSAAPDFSFPLSTPSNAHGAIFGVRVTTNPGGGNTLSLELDANLPASGPQLINFGTIVTGAMGVGTWCAIAYPGAIPADYNGSDVIATAVRSAAIPSEYTLTSRPAGGGNWGYRIDVAYIYM